MASSDPGSPYAILTRLRSGETLDELSLRAVVTGASDGSWSDGQLGAFLMGAAICGLSEPQTVALTEAMVASGEQWNVAGRVGDDTVDKHSTGGVGDKVSLVLGPLLAAAGLPFAKLTGRGLGHTGGTADKLEAIPGMRLEMDRETFVAQLRRVGMAVAIPSAAIAPADRRLYALRDLTATVDCLPLIVSSILAKKLALGAASLVFDVKVGDGAFLPRPEQANELARLLVNVAERCGRRATAVITDMSQPLGAWAGHLCEVREALECLRGEGEARLLEVVLTLGEALCQRAGAGRDRDDLARLLQTGDAYRCFERWASAQGADTAWLGSPSFPLAPVEVVAEAPAAGVLTHIETRRLGLLLQREGAGRLHAGDVVDAGVSLWCRARLGEEVAAGQELARLYVRREVEGLREELARCFAIGSAGTAPPTVYRVLAGGRDAG